MPQAPWLDPARGPCTDAAAMWQRASLALSTALLVCLSAQTARGAAPKRCDMAGFAREELRIPGGDPGVWLFVMRIRAKGPAKGAVVLVQGAGAGGSSIWDLEVRDYSMMRRLACAGFDSYSVDFRGFGGSTLPAGMLRDPKNQKPLVRAEEAARDLLATVQFAKKRSNVEKVDLFAWSWGCAVAGLFSGKQPELVRRLILFAPLFDRRWPSRHKTKGGWYTVDKKRTLSFFKEEREEWPVWLEHVQSMFRFTVADVVRLPNGPYNDLYGPSPVWDPKRVRAPTMVIRGDQDPASTETSARHLFDRLDPRIERRYVVVGGASHFLPRERRYRQLQSLVVDFLSERLEPPPVIKR